MPLTPNNPNSFHSHHHLIPPLLQTNQPHTQPPTHTYTHTHLRITPHHQTVTQHTTPHTMSTPKSHLEPPGSSTTASPAKTTAALASLPPALDLLSRFHHRNKNQHRLSKWWAQADMLRRQLRKIIDELEAFEAVGSSRKGGGKKAAAAEEVVRRRAGYLRWRLGPGAFL